MKETTMMTTMSGMMDAEQRMTSLTNGRHFALVDYKDSKGELRPCYSLTKTECLYIATKFNDVARKDWAKLLDRTKGELSVQKIVDELYDWTARRMADAAENESKADEMLLKRCAYHGLNFSAPFIVMRHWDELHQDGQFWCGEFTTDETDWKLAELIVNMQYACQRHYFGAMAEAYFDNKLRDATANVQRQQKTIEGFNRLPEVFTTDDVMRCFGLSSLNSSQLKINRLLPEVFTTDDVMRCFGLSSLNSSQLKINRLIKDHYVEKTGSFTENSHRRWKFRKIFAML